MFTVKDLDTDLTRAITWQEDTKNLELPKIWKNTAPCNYQTVAELEKAKENRVVELTRISRPIDLHKVLCNRDINGRNINAFIWHITPVFSRRIAIRLSRDPYKDEWRICSAVTKDWIGHIRPRAFSTTYISMGSMMYTAMYEPTPPPLIPENVLKVCQNIKKYTKPFILYKPDSYKITRVDPAIVAKVDKQWRVFAIWGDIVEQAEIISFQEND